MLMHRGFGRKRPNWQATFGPATGPASSTINPPVLAFHEDYVANTVPLDVTVAVDNTVHTGYILRLQSSAVANDTAWSSLVNDITYYFVDIDFEDGGGSVSLDALGFVQPSIGPWSMRAWIERDDDETSDYSNTLTSEIYDFTPSGVSFTDQTGVAASTPIESNEYTLAGVSAGANVPIEVISGALEYALDTGSGYGSWTSVPGTFQLGQKAKLRLTSSATALASVSGAISIGGVEDTWSVQTVGSSDVEFIPSTTQPGLSDNNGGTLDKPFTDIDFLAGYALIIVGVDGWNKTAVTVGGVSCSLLYEHSAEMGFWVSDTPISAGSHTVVVTSTNGSSVFHVCSGTLLNWDGTITSSGGVNWGVRASPVSVSPTVGSGDLAICLFQTEEPLTGTAVTAGTLAITADLAGAHHLRIVTRTSTGAMTVTYSGTNNSGCSYIVLNKA